ncbi:MAG: SIMPL domain-containing protein [Pseudomonadota bacterium]
MAPIWLAFALAVPATQPVTVDIVTVGHVDAPAQRYELTVFVEAKGASEALAKDLLVKRRKTLIDQIIAAGAELGSAETNPMAVLMSGGFIGNDVADEGKEKTARETLNITAPTRAIANKVKAIVASTEGAKSNDMVLSSLDDMTAARRAAKSDGLAKARAEADGYATKLGLGAVTLVAISEKADLGSLMMIGDGKSPPFGLLGRKSTGDTVPVDVPMTVSFRLDPK